MEPAYIFTDSRNVFRFPPKCEANSTLKTLLDLIYIIYTEYQKVANPVAHAVIVQDSKIYLVGTEEGHIHKCSSSYNEQYLESYKAHKVHGNLSLILNELYSCMMYCIFHLYESCLSTHFPSVQSIR